MKNQNTNCFANYILKPLIFTLAAFSFFQGFTCLKEPPLSPKKHFKNAIILIPDGCGIAHMTIARWYKGEPLIQDSMDVSLVQTHSLNTMITGSAAAATAFATGYETWEDRKKAQCLGMLADSQCIPRKKRLPPEKHFAPVASILEAARLSGKATGLISTSRISHATPAAYSAHWHKRWNDNCIIKQQVYQDIDVVFGGGFRNLFDKSETLPAGNEKGKRKDGENLYTVLGARGYTVITTKDELSVLPASSQKVWGIFGTSHMHPDNDRKHFSSHEPSLAKMTKKAIEILSQNPNGFFLMVEGSQIDWASHNNDAFGVVTEYLAFDNAVREALTFAQSDPVKSTLVLVAPDHDNGGMSLGNRGMNYYRFLPQDCISVLKKVSLTAESVDKIIRSKTNRFSPDPDTIIAYLDKYYGISDLSREELTEIIEEFADTFKVDEYGNVKHDSKGTPIVDTSRIYIAEIIGPMLGKRAGIGWTTFGHTGNDVPLFSYGMTTPPKTIRSSDIGDLCSAGFGINLDSVTDRLFVDVYELFPEATITLDTAMVNHGMGSVHIELNGIHATLPFHKNILIRDRDTLSIEGLTIYSQKVHKVYIPRQVVSLL